MGRPAIPRSRTNDKCHGSGSGREGQGGVEGRPVESRLRAESCRAPADRYPEAWSEDRVAHGPRSVMVEG
jgi:hypothetical protein